jgi:hypothetical protein
MTAFVRRASRTIRTIAMNPEDQQDKYLLMEKLARVVRSTGADELVVTGEMWMAPVVDPDDPRSTLRAQEREDRTEVLATTGVRRTGETRSLHSPFRHEGSQVVLSEPAPAVQLAYLPFLPILKVWGIDPEFGTTPRETEESPAE